MSRIVCLILLLSASISHARIDVTNLREASQVASVRESFESAIEMHRKRKMGVGLGFGGPVGTMGVFLQMNFALDVGVNLGYGFGRGFNSFNLGFRQLLTAGSFVPYWGLAYSRWMGRGDNLEGGSSPKVLTEKFLSQSERLSGEFSENLLYPSFGLQIYKMSGDWAGTSVYAEINYLIDIEDFVAGATGGLGLIRYF